MSTGETQAISKQQRERLVWLVELLRRGTCPGRHTLAAEMEVDIRTVQRLITFLRERLGAPIAYDRTRKGYTLTENTWFLPQVTLTEGELFSLLVARQSMAQYRGTPVEKSLERVFEKVAGQLSDRISVHPDYAHGGILSFAPSPVLPVNEEVWNLLLQSAKEQRSVRIRYRSLRSASTRERNIDPYHILNMQGDWYLFAWDALHQKVCQFQLHRIVRATSLERGFTRDPSFSPEDIIRQSFGSFGACENPVTLHLRIHGTMADLLADRTFHPKQKVTRTPDGFEIAFPVSADGDRPFIHVMQWILGMGRHMTLLGPPELRDLVRGEVQAMAARFDAPE